MRHRGSKVLIDDDPAPPVGGEAGRREVEQVGVRLASDGVEKRPAVHLLPALEERHDTALRIALDARDRLTETERRATPAHVIAQRLDHLPIDEVEEHGALIDDRDLDVQRRQHRRVLETDDAGADDDQLARQLVHVGQLIGVEDALAVERNLWRTRRSRSARDENVLRGGARRARGLRRYLDRMRVDEAGRSDDGGDAVASQLMVNDLHFALDDALNTMREIASGNL